MARRLAGRHGYPEYPHHFDVTLHPERLRQPLRWRKPKDVPDGVPVFMKQLGSVWARRLGLESAGGSDMSEWPWDDLKVREYPQGGRE
jgi:hypothetical protein